MSNLVHAPQTVIARPLRRLPVRPALVSPVRQLTKDREGLFVMLFVLLRVSPVVFALAAVAVLIVSNR
jgi:hypothetical protein